MSPEKTNPISARTYWPALLGILHRGVWRQAAVVVALFASMVSMTRLLVAQEDRPEIMPGERRPTKRKDTGPRALGVLQLGANGKASLVPIAILINGKFWDASSYKADPVPMALEYGTVYEAERTGNSLGLFTVGSALHSNAANSQAPWLATGTWRPTGTEPTTKEQKAETAPVGIQDLDAPPRLTRDPNRIKLPPATGSAPASGGSAPSNTPPTDKPKSGDSDEPPRLTKGSSPPSSETPPNSTGGQNPPASNSPSASSPPSTGSESKPTDSKTDSGKPTDSKASTAKADDQAKIPASDSSTSEANRPRLRRGKPAESFADEEVPGYSKPGTKPATDAGKLVATVAATRGDVQVIPAISDASPGQLRPFTFDWLKGEEEDRRKQMTALAKEQLRAYVDTKAKAVTPAKPAHPQTGRHAVPEPIFDTVQMVAYDLWRSNQPVMILSATAHMPPPAAGAAHSEYDSDLQYSILVVAYPDIYNNLHKLYAGVTDKFHLDVTPRLELVDAVDALGDGVGELLFRETNDQGTGWAIYRPTADKLWKMYDSLSPEG